MKSLSSKTETSWFLKSFNIQGFKKKIYKAYAVLGQIQRDLKVFASFSPPVNVTLTNRHVLQPLQVAGQPLPGAWLSHFWSSLSI